MTNPSKQELWRAFRELYDEDTSRQEADFAHYDAQHAQPKEADPDWRHPGAVTAYSAIPGGVLLTCERATIELQWLNGAALRVRVQPGGGEFPALTSPAVIQEADPPPAELSGRDTPERLLLRTADYTCEIDMTGYALTVVLNDPEFVIYGENEGQHPLNGVRWTTDGQVRMQCAHYDAPVFGSGERAFDLNLRGRRLHLWNEDPGGFHRGDDPINYHIPFVMMPRSMRAIGILWDNSARGVLDAGADGGDYLSFEAEGGPLTYTLFFGQRVVDVLMAYTDHTGRTPLPPLWALGYHQSRYSYFTQDEVLEIARELRTREIPCDAIYLDINYMDGYRVFTHDREAFPDFKAMADALHEQGFKLVTILDPGVKIDPDYAVYQSGLDAGIYLKYPDGEPVMGVVWPGAVHFPDFSDPKGRSWWAQHLKTLIDLGVDGIWNDMCEPVIFRPDGPGNMPDYVRHDDEGRGGDHLHHHNLYGLQMGQASHEGLRQHLPERRPFNIIRAGYAGAQRYASSWTGDNVSTWDHLKLSISMTLQMGLSGVPFTGPDVGGFAGDADGELLARWTQVACLMPFFRNHSAITAARQEPWVFGEAIERICREAVQLRYRLLPYLYTVFAQHHFTGAPILRPLFMAFDYDSSVAADIDDCYLLGEHLLVAPVVTPQTLRRTVYLPRGDWYDFWTGQRVKSLYDEEMVTVDAPLHHLPLFVRAGSAIPTWPERQHTADPVAGMTFRLYPGAGTSYLYEDAGDGFGYQRGDYRWTTLTCRYDKGAFTFKREVEGPYQPPYDENAIDYQIIG